MVLGGIATRCAIGENTRPTSREQVVEPSSTSTFTVIPSPTASTPLPTLESTATFTRQVLFRFSGDYDMGDGFWAYHLSISADGTFIQTVWTDFGGEFEYKGLVSIQNHHLVLTTFILEKEEIRQVEKLLPVTLGEQKYLFRDFDAEYHRKNTDGFCSAVRTGRLLDKKGRERVLYVYFNSQNPTRSPEGVPITFEGKPFCL
jgi:hypothetical protein